MPTSRRHLTRTLLLTLLLFLFGPAHAISIEGAIRKVIFAPGAQAQYQPELPQAAADFNACKGVFAQQTPPEVSPSVANRTRHLCFDGFAVLYDSQRKIPVFSAEVLSRESLAQGANLERTDRFFEDARLPIKERASLEDYRGSGFDRGHAAPAADMATPQAMAQSFSLANMVPQSPENNRKAWAGIEKATRHYVARAHGPVHIITGAVYMPGACPIDGMANRPQSYNLERCTIGNGVQVPSHLYKLVYDPGTRRAWAHWLPNTDTARPGKPISYAELVQRTGIEFLPNLTAPR